MEKECDIEDLIKKISFIKADYKLERITEGYSGAFTFKIITSEKNYFLKIMPNRENAINRIKEIIKIYNENNIKVPALVEVNEIEDLNLYYCIYEFIEGQNVNNLAGIKPIDFFYDIGKEIGNKLKVLNSCKIQTNYIDYSEEITDIMKTSEDNFETLFNEEKDTINKYFTNNELKSIKENFHKYATSFNNDKKVLIHSDIKLGNILINENDEIVLIDLERMKYAYPLFCLAWSIGPFSEKQGNEYKALHKGVLNSLYLNGNYNKEQMLFSYILKSYDKTYRVYRDNGKLEFWLEWFKRAYDETKGFTENII